MNKKTFIINVIKIHIVLLILVLTFHSNAQTITTNTQSTNNGFFYSFWNDNSSGSASMTLGAAGNYSTTWSNVGNFTAGKGWAVGKGDRTICFSGSFNGGSNGFLAVYGWTKDPLIEYYVCENHGSWTPPGNTSDIQQKGTYTCDGGTYTIYTATRTNQPSIIGTATFQQFWSVRSETRSSGTVTFANHVAAWKAVGMNMGTTWDYQIMESEGYHSSGSSNITVSECTSNGPSVSITSPATNATYTAPATVTINATASTNIESISKVEFYNGTTKLGEDVSSPYSYAWTNVAAGSYTITAVATDNANNKTTSDAVAIKINTPQGPYQGTAWPIPGTIQFENYDVGGNGVAYNDGTAGSAVTPVVNFRTDEDVDIENCTDTDAGYNIGYTTAGEWLEYTVNVASAGTYKMDLRVACNSDGRTLSVALDGTNIATDVAIPNTASWQTWQTVSINNLNLIAGQKVMRVTIGTTDYINLNYVTFSIVNANNPPIVDLTAPSNNATIASGSSISLTATASDADGSIAKVEFYQGTTLLSSDNSSPYTYNWTNATDGSYSITAKAYDDKNLSATSTAVTITVGNPVVNLLSNPEFDNGTTSWNMQYNNSTAGAFSVVTNAALSGTNAAEVCPTTAGNADWNVQLRQNLPVTSGKTYEISFMAKSAATRTMTLAIQPDVDPYPIYFTQQINLTATPETYTYSFAATTTDAVAKLKFFVGNNSTCINIDKVVITEDTTLTTVITQNKEKVFSIYPNPATDKININSQFLILNDKNNNEIQITNTLGQTVFNSTFNIYNSTFSIDVSQFLSGIYFIRIGNQVFKFIKQ